MRLAGKVHGAQSPFLNKGMDDIIAYDLDLLETFRAGLKEYYGEWEPYGGKHLEAAMRPKGYFERYIMDECKTNYVFGTHIAEGTAEISIDGGKALMHSVARFLDKLD